MVMAPATQRSSAAFPRFSDRPLSPNCPLSKALCLAGSFPMNGILLLVAAAATGVDVGWQPLAGGGYEYIIQIEPQALAAMEQGRDIVSDLPPQLRDIRRYRITIGTGPVPRIGTPPEMTD